MTTSNGTGRTQRTQRVSTRRGSALAVGGLVTALALAACGTEVAGGSAGDLPSLRIGNAAGAQPAADSGGGKLASGWALDGTLPAGPGSGPVLRFTGAPGEDDVRALAAALGLTAAPDERAHGWVVDGPTGELRVRSDASGQWSFARAVDCPTYYVDVDSDDANTGVSCAVADSPDAASDLPLLTDDAALAAAAPVLAAAGVSAPSRVLAGAGSPSGTVAVVVADPTVADLPTSGLRSVVEVDTQGVAGATGWLGDLSTDGDYPVVSAQTAYDRLDALPRALADIGCPEIAPGPMESPADDPMPLPCKVDPLVITGATFGLMLSWEDQSPILVPAWLFAVQGWDDPMAQVAVADEYLVDPTPLPEPTTGTGGGSAVPPDPGATDTPVAPPSDEPGSEPGSGGGTDPSTGTGGGGQPGAETPAVEKAFLDTNGTTLALTGWGGVCAQYSAVLDESSTTVKVQIVGRSTLGPDEACIEIAQELKVVVELDAPLGSRTVVDATTGLPVPVTRTGAHDEGPHPRGCGPS